MKSLIKLSLALLAAASLLAACNAKQPPPQATTSTEQPAITGEPAGFNVDDVTFANDMLLSHQQSAEMAALVPDRSTDQRLITLAANTAATQAPQLQMMKVFLVQWNENPDTNKGQTGHHDVEKGLIDAGTVAQLQGASGKEFDERWLQSMIGHLQGAVDMSNAEIEHGSNVDAVATARQIVDAEHARIEQMQQMLHSD